MAADPPPAEFEVSRLTPDGGGVQSVFACDAHLAHTVRFMWQGGQALAVKRANSRIHGCKGHQDDWPVTPAPS